MTAPPFLCYKAVLPFVDKPMDKPTTCQPFDTTTPKPLTFIARCTRFWQPLLQLSHYDWTWDGIGRWPLSIRCFLWGITGTVILSVGYCVDNHYMQTTLLQQQRQEQQLKQQLRQQILNAATEQAQQSLPQLQADLASSPWSNTVSLGEWLQIITETSAQHNLRLAQMMVGQETTEAFYKTIGIDLLVSGHYHALSAFVAALADLPYLITLHDLSIQRASNPQMGPLMMQVTFKTYGHL